MAERALMERDWPVPTAAAAFPGVTIALAPPVARWSLRTRDPVGLPTAPLRSASYRGGTALWLGPDEWLLLGAEPAADAGVATDISDRQIALTLAGAAAERGLQTGVPIDLSADAFPPGKVARTLFESVEIVVWRECEMRFHIEVWRSFAPWLWRALTLAAEDLSTR